MTSQADVTSAHRFAQSRTSISWRLNAERMVLLGWGRAILLQLAHPLVAAGVFDHSGFRGTPYAAASRLFHTVHAMLALTFGDEPARERTLEAIRTIHRRVNGELPETIGHYMAGTRYSAEDPSLVLWVHATLLESVPMAYEAVIAPLTPQDLDVYCEEAAPIAIALGARPEDVPRTRAALDAYIDRMHASGVLTVGADARLLAKEVVSSRLAALAWPLGWMNRQITIGWLPPSIREQYGFTWDDAGARRSRRALRVLRGVRRVLPRRLAQW